MTSPRLHHVQIAIPEGGEDRARQFFGALLGLPEKQKPKELRQRGGLWFELGELELHLGVESPFQPAKKAHPAFLVADFEALVHRLSQAGYEIRHDVPLAGHPRAFVHDPFGNRVELIDEHRRD